MANSFFLGCVLNPKTNLPCPVFKTKQRTVNVLNPVGDEEGKGYFDDGNHGAEYSSSENSGFPRVHTPTGVRTQRAGYGTVLYTGLCLAANLEDRRMLKIATSVTGAGISSNEHRSHAADKWWSAAKNEFDLAYSVEVEGGEEVEEDFEAEYERGTFAGKIRDKIEEMLNDSGNVDGSLSVRSVHVYGTVTKEGGTSEADVYPYDQSHGCRGAETMVPFYCVTEELDDDKLDYPWEYVDPLERIDHLEIFDNVFGCMVLTGDVSPDLVRFIGEIAAKAGKKKLFEEVMLVSLLGKKLKEAGEFSAYETDTLYEGLIPFRLNPQDPAVQAAVSSLTKKERVAIERRAERVRALGLDKLAGFDL